MPTYEDCLKLVIAVFIFCLLLVGAGKCMRCVENTTNNVTNSTESSGSSFFFGFILGSGS